MSNYYNTNAWSTVHINPGVMEHSLAPWGSFGTVFIAFTALDKPVSSQSQAGVSWWAHKFHFFLTAPHHVVAENCIQVYPVLPGCAGEANTCPQMTPQWLKLMKTLLTSCARSFQCLLCHERYMTHISHLLRLLSSSTYNIFNFKVLRSLESQVILLCAEYMLHVFFFMY